MESKKNLKSYTLRLDYEMYKTIKLHAYENEISIRSYLIDLIQKDLYSKKDFDNQ